MIFVITSPTNQITPASSFGVMAPIEPHTTWLRQL